MNILFKQAIYIIICSFVVGILFNFTRPNGIPIIAGQISGFSDDYQTDEFIIELIDLGIAKKFYNDGILFIDARDEISFNEGHIVSAISSTPYDDMVDKIFIVQGFNEPIVVYCDDAECGLSEDLAYQLQAEGFSKIFVFSGGWNQWVTANLPVTK